MADRKTEFWWASVVGADCEPVEVTMLDGERVAYTCGCADPFYLDRPDSLVVLVATQRAFDKDIGQMVDAPLNRPLTPKQKEKELKAREAQIKRDAKRGIHHGWRGPR